MKPIARVIARRVEPFDVTIMSVRVPAEPFQLRMRATDAVTGCIAFSGPGSDSEGFSERCYCTYGKRFEKFVPDVVVALESAGFAVELDRE